MINHLESGKLPYVDGMAPTGQESINWLKNGERLCGASSKTSNDGTYNRVSVSIQQNVVNLNDRANESVDKVNEVIDSVNLIKENLGNIGDVNLIEQVNQNTSDITSLKLHVIESDDRADEFRGDIATINLKLGHRPTDDNTDRTIYGDLFWLKSELGAYIGFDINGNVIPGAPGSGLKYRFSQVNSLVLNNSRRIQKLEEDWISSDVGQLTTDLADMRYEIGRKQLANGINIYTRIKKLEDGMGNDAGSLDAIKDAIDFTNQVTIASRVSSLESTTVSLANTINRPTTGVLARLGSVEGKLGDINIPGTIIHDVDWNRKSIDNLESTVGQDGSSGMRREIADLNAAIGPANEPGSINGRITILQQEVSQNTLSIGDVVDRVGDQNSGLTKATAIMSTDLYGDAGSTDPFKVDGIKKVAKQYFDDKPNILNRPVDSGTWIYSNGGWKLQSSIMVAVEKKNFTTEATEAETIIPFVDFDQTIANGVIFNSGIVEFTDAGMVKAKLEIELDDLLGTDNFEVSISHQKADGTIARTPLQEFTLRSNSKRLYTRDWLYNISIGDKVAVSIKALDPASVKTVTIRDMTSVIVPV